MTSPVLDDGNGKVSTELRLTVIFDPVSRAFRVEGPVQDKATCYMMLEMAKDAVREYVEQSKDTRVIRPNFAVR